ncbi:MAG: cation diffusion facilitator family transporter [Actinobacteria bacterium]|nr:cation diffusion facilitator family transporter [Actinomycetota bacterium]
MTHNNFDYRNQKKKIILTFVLNLLFATGELIIGLIANSLTLLSSSVHDFSDAASLILSFIGVRYAERKPDKKKTFGYKKIQIITAFVNALFLVGLSILIFREAVIRLITPRYVDSSLLIWVAVGSIIINGTAVLVLRRDRKNLNIRSAMLHLLDDFFAGTAILIGGLVIRYTDYYAVDSILAFLIGGLLIWGSYGVIRESLDILLDSVPREIKFSAVHDYIRNYNDEILDVHDLHIWAIGDNETALSAHISVNDKNVSLYRPMLSELEDKLRSKFKITHVTIELESLECKSDEVCSS